MREADLLGLVLILTWITGLVVSTLIACFDKWGWFDFYELRRSRWMPKACKYCTGFWLSCLGLLIFVLLSGEFHLTFLIMPFAATSIVKWVSK